MNTNTKNHQIILIVISFLFVLACGNNTKNYAKTQKDESPDLSLDHLNIWVNNPKVAQKRLMELGFSTVPDSLSQVHHGQGTTGKYFHFLNGYLELIYINNQQEFDANNTLNDQLDFKERADFNKNGASPFSIALKMKKYEVDKIPFECIQYHQEWMPKDQSIYAAKNSKLKLKEPSIFVVYPSLESDQFDSIEDLGKIPDDYAFAREFYKHPNGAKRITEIRITTTEFEKESQSIQALNRMPLLEVKEGNDHLLELFFDQNIQKKKYDLRPELPLIIYL